jgi:uncharacterized protein YcbK (DUF882 family)
LDNYDTAVRMGTTGRLWRRVRTACLIAGMACAAVMLVDPPTALAARTHPDTAIETKDVPQTPRRKPSGVQLASLGSEAGAIGFSRNGLTERSVRWNASPACLSSSLRRVVGEIAANFGPVTVNSTCRSHGHNARVGGARQSHHLTGNAADFRINGDTRRVLAFLGAHRSVGGLKHYGGGVFHIDTGPRRTW